MRQSDKITHVAFKGKMTAVGKPPERPDRPNFVILWDGMDWSGFRTIPECEAQFPELEARENNGVERFTVVERF